MANLAKKFPEVKLDLHNSTKQDVDIYTTTKRDIFDFYKTRPEKIGRNGRNIEDYKNFDREKIDDDMLLKLKTFVERLEKMEEERIHRTP